ncbi:MAG: hypothetical protein R6U44_05075 [Archaeoglobaceae archaeon]
MIGFGRLKKRILIFLVLIMLLSTVGNNLREDFPLENAETLVSKLKLKNPKIKIHVSGKGKI